MNKIYFLILIILISCQKEDYKKLWDESKNHFEKTEYKLAISKLNKVIEINPEFDSAHINLAHSYMFTNPAKGLEIINNTIDKFPNNLKATYIRGLIYNELGNYTNAISDIEKASNDFNLDYNMIMLDKAKVLINMDYTEDAIKLLKDLIDSDKLNYKAYTWLAIAHENHDISELIYNKSHYLSNLVEDNVEEKKYLYMTFIENELAHFDYKIALNYINKSIIINPRYSFNYYLKSDIFNDLSMLDSTLFYIDLAIENETTKNLKSNYHVFKSNIYKTLEKYKEALNELDLALNIDINNASAYLDRYILKKDFFNELNEAQKDFDKALELQPNIMDNVVYVSKSPLTK